ncbi:MAG: ABC transporter permease [Deltaproteobacteria bacterium]|nr:ABC transporter permease [Deltaproteobacteria bacterium]
MSIFAPIGKAILSFLHDLYEIADFVISSLNTFLFHLTAGRRAISGIIYKQVYFTGIEAFSIISWIAAILGVIIVTQAISILPMFGGERLIGEILVWVVIRELGPVFAAIIVIARSGTAMAAELGSMRVNNEVIALEAMGIDPGRYLVMPRVIGTAISTFVLTFYFEIITILGGYLLAGFGKRITFGMYISSVLETMGFTDIIASLLKSIIFGLIIGAVATLHGLRVGKSITEIPQQTTKAVISSLFIVFIVDGIITAIFFI